MAKKPTEITLACGVLGEAQSGSIIVQTFTRTRIEWILDIIANAQQHVLRSSPGFYRIQFFDSGDFFKTTCRPELDTYLAEYDGWGKLTPRDATAMRDQDLVRTEGWTIGIGDSDVIWTFREKHTERELETRNLTLNELHKFLKVLA